MPKPAIYREPFDDNAQFLAAIIAASIPSGGASHDGRLEFSAAATGAGENVPSEGGFVVPEEMAGDLWIRTLDTGILLRRCTAQPITVGNKLVVPGIDESSRADGSRFGGARLYWVDEGTTPTPTKPKFKRINLVPKKLLGLSYATDELVSDARALAVWLERVFALEASFTIEDAIINGTGAGRPLGILNSGALITVSKESGQSASTIVAANLKNMAARLWGPSWRRAIWLTSNDAFAQVADASFSNGAPVVTIGADGTRRILGMPVELTEYTPALGSAGDIVLGDFSQYLLGEIAPEFLSSIHVRFLYDELVFRTRYRVDGQPAWASPVTPNNSSTTQSPFVSLEAR